MQPIILVLFANLELSMSKDRFALQIAQKFQAHMLLMDNVFHATPYARNVMDLNSQIACNAKMVLRL